MRFRDISKHSFMFLVKITGNPKHHLFITLTKTFLCLNLTTGDWVFDGFRFLVFTSVCLCVSISGFSH